MRKTLSIFILAAFHLSLLNVLTGCAGGKSSLEAG